MEDFVDVEISEGDLGFVSVHRSLMKKGYYMNSKYVHLWVHLLMRASWKEKEFLFDGRLRHLMPGQFITSRKSLSRATGISQTTIERILQTFEDEEQIGQQKLNKFRIISIVNWDLYQLSGRRTDGGVNKNPIEIQTRMPKNGQQNGQQNAGKKRKKSTACVDGEHESGQVNGQQADNKRTASGQQADTINKDNKDNKDNKNPIRKKVFLEAVELSTAEEEKLRQRFGSDFDRAIDILNNYKMATGKKYKSDYHAIVGWVAKRIEEDSRKGGSRIAE